MDHATPLKALIYGSCVARDLARIESERISAGHYTARQSWISAYSEPRPAPSSKLRSAFQQRMVEGDFRSTGRQILTSTRPATYDIVLLDLIDERLGVLPYEGSWITQSNELQKSRAIPESALEHLVPFGSDKHFEMWQAAATNVHADLAPYLEKTFVLAAQFASTTAEGEDVAPFRDEPAEIWNARYDRYYDHLRSLGFTVIDQQQASIVTNNAHEWGPTPFHYVDEAYVAFANDILPR